MEEELEREEERKREEEKRERQRREEEEAARVSLVFRFIICDMFKPTYAIKDSVKVLGTFLW